MSDSCSQGTSEQERLESPWSQDLLMYTGMLKLLQSLTPHHISLSETGKGPAVAHFPVSHPAAAQAYRL